MYFFNIQFYSSKMKTEKEATLRKPDTLKVNPVVHFEMPYDDKKRMVKFYSAAFGWKAQMLGEEHGNYVLATTAEEVDEQGAPKRNGVINGGFYERDKNKPAQYPSVVIAVLDIQEAMKKIEEAGGHILGEPMEIPGYGLYVSFYDTEGNRISIMEPTMK